MKTPDWQAALRDGQVIPACPLVLDSQRRWSERHQIALLRYYADAGAGGVAVGVHSTQFAIRDPQHNLFEPVLRLAAAEIDSLAMQLSRPLIKIAGICGETQQACREAETAVSLGYHVGLLSLAAWPDASEDVLLQHCREVARTIPLFGFYLQPAVGGRVLRYDFWRGLCELPELRAVKVAPFNRYQTLDVARAVIDSGRDDVALYTGNDDHIIGDLLTPLGPFDPVQGPSRFFDGGLLGQWGVWTRRAVVTLQAIKRARSAAQIDRGWLAENTALTDANGVIFDAANGFAGCLPGILEVLRRQGLVPTAHCLDPTEVLSRGQAEELDRIARQYPLLSDDSFVRENRDRWLA